MAIHLAQQESALLSIAKSLFRILCRWQKQADFCQFLRFEGA
jgi:hypothetical protein